MNSGPIKKQSENSIKKQILESHLFETNPMVAFHSFLNKIMENKILENSDEKPIKTNSINNLENNYNLKNLDSANFTPYFNENLKEIARKNQIPINASQKIKRKFKLEKIDPEIKFNRHKLKAFKELNTFINAKEFLETLNPYNKKHITKSTDYLQQKKIYTIKKIHRQTADFFYSKNKEFTERLKELDEIQKKNSVVFTEKKKDHKNSISSLGSFETNIFDQIENQKENKNKFIKNRTSEICKKIIETNKKEIELFEKNKNKNNHSKKDSEIKPNCIQNKNLKNEIIQKIFENDDCFNRFDFLRENEGIYEDKIDGFYNELINFMEKEIKTKPYQLENHSKELSALLELEKTLNEFLKEKSENYNRDKSKENKYRDYLSKAHEMLKMVTKTSKEILNFGTEQPLKKKNSLFISTTRNLDLKKTLSSDNQYNNLISPRFLKKISTKKSEEINKTSDYFIKSQLKKGNQETIQDIIKRTNDFSNEYENEKNTFRSLEKNQDDFYSSVSKKINPTLDSIILTLERPKLNNCKIIRFFDKKNQKRPLVLL